MRHIRLSMAVLAALVLAMATMSPGVMAQADPAEHPLVGTWIIDSSPDDTTDPLELGTFNSGGTVVSASAQGIALGSWVPTGERTADITFNGPVFLPEAGFLGFVTIRGNAEVSEDGQSFTGTYTFEPPSGLAEAVGIPAGELGPGDVTAQRVAVEPMGEPVGPLPDFSQLLPPTGQASPAPETSPIAPEASPAVEASPATQASPVVDGSPAPEASPAG